MSKRAVVVLLLIGGSGLAYLLFYIERTPIYPPTFSLIVADMIFWGSVSAALSAARTPGKWNEKITRASGRPLKKPHWVWPLFMVLLINANYLVALAVMLGMLSFAPRGTPAQEVNP